MKKAGKMPALPTIRHSSESRDPVKQSAAKPHIIYAGIKILRAALNRPANRCNPLSRIRSAWFFR